MIGHKLFEKSHGSLLSAIVDHPEDFIKIKFYWNYSF